MEKSGTESGGEKEVNGKEINSTSVQPSYKTLPDDDSNWQSKEKMVKQNGTENEMNDEAKERMLKDEPKAVVTPMKNASEVKFGSSNGDTKIDIEIVKQSLSGMGKEELMKYANDPFWIRLRWFLFVAFWLTWLAMLAGAIYIIVNAPKCAAPQPKNWFEESPMIELDALDTPEHDLKSFEKLLGQMNQRNVKAISLPLIFKNVDGFVTNFTSIDERLGSMEDLENLIKAAKANEQHIVLEFDPNSSSEQHDWFKNSVQQIEPYKSYYVWANESDKMEGARKPPNNWNSVGKDESAWQWNEQRKQYYLHQFGKSQPDLNFENPKVIKEFEEILKFWLEKGVSGFLLGNVRYLTEDPKLTDTTNTHKPTRDREENAKILKNWRAVVENYTNGEGLFALKDYIVDDMLHVFNDNNSGKVIDLPQTYRFLQNITAEALNESISAWISQTSWPGWRLNGDNDLKQASPQVAESITLMTLLLPGTPIVRWRDANNTEFQTLVKTRKEPSFQFGETKTYTRHNNTVFAYTRHKSSNPGYLVAYNSGDQEITVDFSQIPELPANIDIIAQSSNYRPNAIGVKKLSSNAVLLSPRSTLVMTYVSES